jgi:pimeloyl-ACP methyl ester carboxylesterase
MNKHDIILLHGALGSKKQFEELQQILEPNFNVHSFDFTGHGKQSIPDKSFTIELFTYDLADYCIQHNIFNANIFGYSMGGYVALNYAAKFPDKVNKIYTLATKFDWNERSARQEAAMLKPELIEQKIPGFAKNLISLHGEHNWKLLLNKTAELILNLGNKPVLNADTFNKITARCKLCVGENDKMVSIEETEKTHKQIKNSAFYVYKHTEHPLEKIDMKLLATDILSFI